MSLQGLMGSIVVSFPAFKFCSCGYCCMFCLVNDDYRKSVNSYGLSRVLSYVCSLSHHG